MNLLHILTISPYYIYRKCVEATIENLNSDLRLLPITFKFKFSFVAPTHFV